MTCVAKLPKIIIIDDIKYMCADHVKLYDPSLFVGCSKGIRTFIALNQLSKKFYIWAYFQKKE
jgi:hypothetical protein